MLTYWLASLAVAGSVGASNCPRAPTVQEERAVRAADAVWARANASGDIEAIQRLFHPALIVVSGAGAIRTRDQELDEIRPNPAMTTHFFRTDDVSVRMCGAAALVVGHARWRITYQGRDIDHSRRYTSIYSRRNGLWQMMHLQVSGRMPPPE